MNISGFRRRDSRNHGQYFLTCSVCVPPLGNHWTAPYIDLAYFTIYINERPTVVHPSVVTCRIGEPIYNTTLHQIIYGFKDAGYVILLQIFIISPGEGIVVVTHQQFGQVC